MYNTKLILHKNHMTYKLLTLHHFSTQTDTVCINFYCITTICNYTHKKQIYTFTQIVTINTYIKYSVNLLKQ